MYGLLGSRESHDESILRQVHTFDTWDDCKTTGCVQLRVILRGDSHRSLASPHSLDQSSVRDGSHRRIRRCPLYLLRCRCGQHVSLKRKFVSCMHRIIRLTDRDSCSRHGGRNRRSRLYHTDIADRHHVLAVQWGHSNSRLALLQRRDQTVGIDGTYRWVLRCPDHILYSIDGQYCRGELVYRLFQSRERHLDAVLRQGDTRYTRYDGKSA